MFDKFGSLLTIASSSALISYEFLLFIDSKDDEIDSSSSRISDKSVSHFFYVENRSSSALLAAFFYASALLAAFFRAFLALRFLRY